MSWLHCCFIRKQLFTLSLLLPPSLPPFPSPAFFPSPSPSPPHYLSSLLHPALPPYLVMLFSSYIFLTVPHSHWCKLANARGRSYKSPTRGHRQSGCHLPLLLPSENDKEWTTTTTTKSRISLSISSAIVHFLFFFFSNELGGCENLQRWHYRTRQKLMRMYSQTVPSNKPTACFMQRGDASAKKE